MLNFGVIGFIGVKINCFFFFRNLIDFQDFNVKINSFVEALFLFMICAL